MGETKGVAQNHHFSKNAPLAQTPTEAGFEPATLGTVAYGLSLIQLSHAPGWGFGVWRRVGVSFNEVQFQPSKISMSGWYHRSPRDRVIRTYYRKAMLIEVLYRGLRRLVGAQGSILGSISANTLVGTCFSFPPPPPTPSTALHMTLRSRTMLAVLLHATITSSARTNLLEMH